MEGKIYKKWWFWLIVLVIFGKIGSAGNDDKPSIETTTKPVVTEKKEKTAEEIKKEADEKAKADAKAKAQVAKDEETARLQAIEDKKAEAAAREAEKPTYDTGITYDQLARTPDKYFDQKVKFYGKVIHVMEDRLYVKLRIAVNDNYDTILIATCYKNQFDSRVLENDEITIRGVSTGITDYGFTRKSTKGGKVMLPGVGVDMIDYN
ncbi:toxin regulator [Clostridium sp. FP1]|uniref:toxin regulator n=1 Tax=Clostridium sp. FP1 TaxID=2724076 RepID=UPI0013E8F821|nr:toxin regulator [Clostridium sp. FP1]MBZ9635607.1 toxin regulator [Clostridium sp. FP1]